METRTAIKPKFQSSKKTDKEYDYDDDFIDDGEDVNNAESSDDEMDGQYGGEIDVSLDIPDLAQLQRFYEKFSFVTDEEMSKLAGDAILRQKR